jgi:uncharacterized RDD family membrane protein YckC
MNREDIDFDKLFDEDMPFKPLTDGLGFHHEKKENLNNLKARQKDLEQGLNSRADQLKRERNNEIQTSGLGRSNKASSGQRTMGDLAPFYSEKKRDSVELDVTSAPQTSDGILASSFIRLAAFLLDGTIILSSLGFILITAALNSELSLAAIGERLTFGFAVANLMPLLGLFYLFYFSFFDKTKFSTPGKRLLGVRVKSLEGAPMTMGQSFSRALVLAISSGLFGLIDLHSKLSNTKVIKR